MRVLDEVADAIQLARNSRPQTVHSSFKLEDQFEGAIVDVHWRRLERCLKCPLQPLEFDQGHWWLPTGLATIWDLCEFVLQHHPNWESPRDQTSSAWRNAQIFAVVRRDLVDVTNMRAEQIRRESRLIQDLHF